MPLEGLYRAVRRRSCLGIDREALRTSERLALSKHREWVRAPVGRQAMQDQPRLGKAKPQEDDGEQDAGTIDQGRKAAIDHRDLGSPRADPGLVFGDGCQQPLETL